MILCVSVNAAIDKTVTVAGFRLGAIHRPSSVLMLPGGKGCNVARVLKTLGEDPLVTGWTGGHAGRFIEAGLRSEGIRTAFVRILDESRTCLSVLDSTTGLVTEIYERGEPISSPALRAFRRRFHALVRQAQMVTLSGSLPAQVPSDFYAELILEAKRAGVPVLLDSSGEALEAGVAAGPYLVKPNRDELITLVGEVPSSNTALASTIRGLAQRTGAKITVTLGAGGALAADSDGVWSARSPVVAALSAVGSGDAMLAGMAAALLHGASLDSALRLGVAAGAANTLSIGAGRLRLEDVKSLAPEVEVSSLRT
jgi:tagatose 6-phosphate kinase